jgi:hypothetical protein
MTTSERLLSTLRQIAVLDSPEQTAFIDVQDAEDLSDLGLIEIAGLGQHRIIPAGKKVPRKTDEDRQAE